ncbi:MAG: NAD(P) transhydrogenase subunit alpha part 1 [Actinobacteria bacterium ADurb.Bin346]|nr:MAG: NAD(P) transhydrogenase subunit alpha part 1 [Actinobacteria bacterium ADurb.Bin346]
MIIGIPKEIMQGEKRVSAIPETVKKYISLGATVIVEKNAGIGSLFNDSDYIKAGAEIENDVARIYNKADLILKVKEPIAGNDFHEADLLRKGQYLITFIHPASPANHDMVKKLAERGVISLTLDGIPRISRAQSMDALTSMSTCAGYKGMIIAVNDLNKFMPQIFSATGMIKPASVLIVGAGVAGLQAIATAKRLGAVVYAADIRPEAAEQAKSLGANIVDTGVPASVAEGKGGYANDLPEEYLLKERQVLKDAISKMDIVFLSALVPGKLAPILLTEDMVKIMSPGSVIVDISIDQGGNCEITTPGIRDVKHGVIIEGIKNIPGMLPVSATSMFASNVYNLVNYLMKNGSISLDLNDEIVSSILVTIDNKIVHAGAREAMGI